MGCSINIVSNAKAVSPFQFWNYINVFCYGCMPNITLDFCNNYSHYSI